MKKRTYQLLTSIPVVGTIVRIGTSPGRSMPVRTAQGSLVWEECSKDPRGALAAHNEWVEKLLDPAKEYIKEHPDVQLTAGLVNKLYLKNQRNK